MPNQLPPPVVLIEKTSKKYKLIQVIGGGTVILGALLCAVIMAFVTTGDGESLGATVGVIVAGIGFLTWAIGAGLAWWNHA